MTKKLELIGENRKDNPQRIYINHNRGFEVGVTQTKNYSEHLKSLTEVSHWVLQGYGKEQFPKEVWDYEPILHIYGQDKKVVAGIINLCKIITQHEKLENIPKKDFDRLKKLMDDQCTKDTLEIETETISKP